MKKFLFLFLAIMALSMSAQQKGDLLVGVNTSLTDNRVTDLHFTPEIGYQFSDNLQVGIAVTYFKTDVSEYDRYSVDVKYYPTALKLNSTSKVRLFAGGSFGTGFLGDSDYSVGLKIGGTGYLNRWFYLEPNLGFVTDQYDGGAYLTRLNTGITCGIKL